MSALQFPQIKISYCVGCKWSLRASWYQQEIIQTFVKNPKYENYHIGEISLIPSLVSGTFKIEVFKNLQELLENQGHLIWERKRDGGFPDSKLLKQKIRDLLFPGERLGHIDNNVKSELLITEENPKKNLNNINTTNQSQNLPNTDCKECKELNTDKT
ncbi:hypothetical protein PACTADRAFT_50384 [Pachysolen tannophilus NRRL Y-2460]|uniref:Uncharacterized protein n=1 Tax=Pachysolen tannophilus NRRL Y-2460 TaxID=669874 RepID=A0A1E4TVC0_PACTA|nr:hypothetical protein PACTADRAFT_50384 [Pachysolen tannophilus NRRL Y-2460]